MRDAAHAASTRTVLTCLPPWLVLPLFFFPALSLLPGHIPAQEQRCAEVGKLPMSRPISAIKSSHTLSCMPGISHSFFNHPRIRLHDCFYPLVKLVYPLLQLLIALTDLLQHVNFVLAHVTRTCLKHFLGRVVASLVADSINIFQGEHLAIAEYVNELYSRRAARIAQNCG